MSATQFKLSGQFLEERRMLAADVDILSDVVAVIASDVNADGNVSAIDALAIINGLNAEDASSEPPNNAVAESLDVDGNGDLSAADALQVINRLNSGSTSVVDSVMEQLSTRGEDLFEQLGLNNSLRIDSLRTSVSDLVDRLNEHRREGNFSRETVAEVLNEVSGIVDASALPFDQRVDTILSRVEGIATAVGLDTGDVGRVADQVRGIIVGLSFGSEQRFDELSERVSDTVTAWFDHLNEGWSFASIGNLIDQLREDVADISLPSITSVLNLVNVYQTTTGDDTLSADERIQLKGAADAVLQSAGMSETLRNRVLV